MLLIELWTDELASVVVVVTDENNTVLPVPFSGMVFVCDMLLSGVEMKADPPTMALAQATRCKPRKSMFGSLVCIKVLCSYNSCVDIQVRTCL